jgi:hypothetical protein
VGIPGRVSRKRYTLNQVGTSICGRAARKPLIKVLKSSPWAHHSKPSHVYNLRDICSPNFDFISTDNTVPDIFLRVG